MAYERPGSLEQALALLAEDNWTVLAGGTDVFPALQDRPAAGKILDVSALSDLREVVFRNGYWRIGALATWRDLIATELPAAFDGLKLAAREIGSIQIQNRATLIGNICNASPAADGVPPLLTLDAIVEISSQNNIRQLPLKDFILGNRQTALQPDELVSALLIPEASAVGFSSFTKLGARKYLVISIAMVAARIAIDDERKINDAAISVGACSAIAPRLTSLEKELIGASIDSELSSQIKPTHFSKLTPLDDIRAPAKYRLSAASELVARAIKAIQEQAGER